VLVEIAARAPTSLDALAEVSGVGPAKLARYGPALLKLVKEQR
jgi:ATP-dependent DNA helicase RecQ